MNYVILASEKTGTIFTTTTTMQNAMKDYQVQLVILEPNETLNFEEIALSRLTKLKMAYPSITKDNDTEEAQLFERAFKKKNKIPNTDSKVFGIFLYLKNHSELNAFPVFIYLNHFYLNVLVQFDYFIHI